MIYSLITSNDKLPIVSSFTSALPAPAPETLEAVCPAAVKHGGTGGTGDGWLMVG